MRRRTRVPLVALAAVTALACTGTAHAAWLSAGGGAGSAGASALGTPGSGAVSAPTSSSLTLTWGVPLTGPSPTGYLVLRNGVQVTTGGCAESVTRVSAAVTCTDTGLSSATTYDYVVRAARGSSWLGPVTAAFGGTTASFALTSATPVGGSKKYRFGGVGSSGTTTITVEVCRGTTAVCTRSTTGWVETVTFAPAGAGGWSTGPTTTRLELSPGPYTASATQAPNESTLAFDVV